MIVRKALDVFELVDLNGDRAGSYTASEWQSRVRAIGWSEQEIDAVLNMPVGSSYRTLAPRAVYIIGGVEHESVNGLPGRPLASIKGMQP